MLEKIKRAPLFEYLSAERFPLLVIVGFFFLACLLVSPFKNVAVIDDWTYAWSVENFIKTGHLAVLDWSAHYPVFQTLWGGLFSIVFGFSFGVLRISSVVLGAIGCIALYLTLRELEIDRWSGLLGALMLAVNPLFFVLSFSFMTDVPFLSMMNAAAFFYVAGIKRDRAALLWWGGLFAVAAYLSRQVGLVIPLALLPSLLQKRLGWSGFLKRLLPVLATLCAMGFLWWWEVKHFGRTSVMKQKMEALDYLWPIDFKHLLKESIEALALNAFWACPLLLAAISVKPRWWPMAIAGLAIVTAAVMHWGFHGIFYPLDREGTWNVDELGDARGLMHGTMPARSHVNWIIESLRWVMLVSWAILIAGLVRWAVSHREKIRSVIRIREWIGNPAMIIIVLAMLQLALINELWFYYDRYYLVLLPAVICFSLKVAADRGFARSVALAGIVIFGMVSIAGTIDMLRFDDSAWNAYYELRRSGIPAAEIDAGYAINGWMLYAHSENLPPGSDPTTDVPYITGDADLSYKISTSPSDSSDYETTKEITVRMPFWSVSNKLYVLHKREEPSEDPSK